MRAWMPLMSVLLAASIALAQKPQQAFTIAIRTGQTVVIANSPIEVQVTLKNTSNHDFRFYLDNSHKAELSGFGAEVTDAQGLAPKITEYYDELSGEKAPRETVTKADKEFVIVGSGGTLPLAPGATLELQVDVAQLYDLTKPGMYTIQVTRTDPADGITVKSNPLKITVTE